VNSLVDIIELSTILELFKRGAIFIDVRDSKEFSKGHILGAINFSADNIDELLKILSVDVEIVVYGDRDDERGIELTERLIDLGFMAYRFVGGYQTWVENLLPIKENIEMESVL